MAGRPDIRLFVDLEPEAVDRSPGLSVAAGPYVRPDGCPARLNWRPGDWVVWACRHNGNVLPRHRLRRYGLEYPRKHRGFRGRNRARPSRSGCVPGRTPC